MKTVSETSETLIAPISALQGSQKKSRKSLTKLLEEIIDENVSNMGKETVTQFQEAQRVPYEKKKKKNKQEHTGTYAD